MSIGERIRQARKMSEFSLRDLAARVDVSAQAISKYETDADIPSSGVLLQLAKALNVRTEFFLRPRPVVAITPAFRKRASLSAKQKDATLAKIQDWLERYLEIEEISAPDASGFTMPESFPRPVATIEDVERSADDLRKEWDLGEYPIRNLTELLEDKGIKVGTVETTEKFDACTFWTEEEGHVPVIAVRTGIEGDRQRFSLAHELGHLMIQPGELDEEKAANRFAGAFLVPARAARRELEPRPVRHHLSIMELQSLKEKYGLSMQAWVYRARDLGILTESGAKQMFRTFSANNYRKKEPGNGCLFEEPQRRDRLVLGTLAEGIISEMRAAELMGMSQGEFSRMRIETTNAETPHLRN